MFCSNCGNPVQEGQAVCLSCGFALDKRYAVKPSVDAVSEIKEASSEYTFSLWPSFNDSYGRLTYFIGILKLFAIGFAGGLVMVALGANETALGLFALFVLLPLLLWSIPQNLSLFWNRLYNIGIKNNGYRIITMIVAIVPIIGWVPFLMALFAPEDTFDLV